MWYLQNIRHYIITIIPTLYTVCCKMYNHIWCFPHVLYTVSDHKKNILFCCLTRSLTIFRKYELNCHVLQHIGKDKYIFINSDIFCNI